MSDAGRRRRQETGSPRHLPRLRAASSNRHLRLLLARRPGTRPPHGCIRRPRGAPVPALASRRLLCGGDARSRSGPEPRLALPTPSAGTGQLTLNFGPPLASASAVLTRAGDDLLIRDMVPDVRSSRRHETLSRADRAQPSASHGAEKGWMRQGLRGGSCRLASECRACRVLGETKLWRMLARSHDTSGDNHARNDGEAFEKPTHAPCILLQLSLRSERDIPEILK